MSAAPVPVRLVGGDLAQRLWDRLHDEPFDLAGDDLPGAVMLVVGTASDLPDSARPPVVLACPFPSEAEWSLLREGRVDDVIDTSASASEVAARLHRAWARRVSTTAFGWRGELEHLLGLVRDLATSGDLPALQHRIVQRLADAAGVERCSLVLFDEGDETRAQATVVAASDKRDVQSMRISLDAYPEIREAIRTEAPVVVADVAHNPIVDPVRERLEKAGVGAIAVFPVSLDGRLLGVLVMRASSPFQSPAALALADTAAIATAIALRHGRLIERALDEKSRALRRYEGFLAHLSDGVAVLDEAGRIALLNPAGAAILGVEGDARGRRLDAIAPPADPIAAQLILREIARGARVLDADLEVVRENGERIVLALSAGQLKSAEMRAILSFRDVTEQRRIQAELRRTSDFLERLIDSSGDAIVAADLTGRLIVFNRAAEKLFGATAHEARTAMDVRDIYPQGGAEEVMRLLRESPTGQIEAVRAYGRTKKGELVPLELSAAIVRVGGRDVASVGLLRDLRERVRVEGELARARARLIDMEKQGAITALAGATAHELNQPLTVILGYVELLRRKADDHTRRPLEAIATEAERMAHIVKRISKLTRIETVAYPGEKQIADLERSSEPPRAAGATPLPPTRR